MSYPKKILQRLNRFATGSEVGTRIYQMDAEGIETVCEWSRNPQTSDVFLSVDGGASTPVSGLFESDPIEQLILPEPTTLSKVAFMDLAYPLLGEGLAGISRYGDVLTQAKASTSPLVVAAMERYQHASVFEREDVAGFLDILVADAGVDLTQAERDAIVNGWPNETRT